MKIMIGLVIVSVAALVVIMMNVDTNATQSDPRPDGGTVTVQMASLSDESKSIIDISLARDFMIAEGVVTYLDPVRWNSENGEMPLEEPKPAAGDVSGAVEYLGMRQYQVGIIRIDRAIRPRELVIDRHLVVACLAGQLPILSRKGESRDFACYGPPGTRGIIAWSEDRYDLATPLPYSYFLERLRDMTKQRSAQGQYDFADLSIWIPNINGNAYDGPGLSDESHLVSLGAYSEVLSYIEELASSNR